MPRGDDFPPLFTLGGPIGWALAAVSVFSKVFGNSAVRKQREEVFRKHRERNEARGWKPGDNILAANTAAAEIEARRSAAERAIRQVNDLLSKVPEAPWLARKQLGKSGRLYRLRDVRENVIRNNRAINDAKVKAAEKEAAARRLARDRGIRDSGVARSRAGRSSVGTLQSGLAGVIVDQWLGRVLDADAARKRLSTASNRRGALATRSLQSRSRTNRRGSLAQPRAARNSAGTVRSAGSGVRSATQSGPESQHSTAGSVGGESAQSAAARRTMQTSRSLPTQTQGATRTNPLYSQLSSVGVARLFRSASRLTSRATGGSRSLLQQGSSSGLGTRPSTLSFGTSLTPLNATGVSSASRQDCKCPEPKRKKSREKGCTNKLVSRTVRDGIITIKRKQTCPPSRPK